MNERERGPARRIKIKPAWCARLHRKFRRTHGDWLLLRSCSEKREQKGDREEDRRVRYVLPLALCVLHRGDASLSRISSDFDSLARFAGAFRCRAAARRNRHGRTDADFAPSRLRIRVWLVKKNERNQAIGHARIINRFASNPAYIVHSSQLLAWILA